MLDPGRSNPVDDICQRLSLADLFADVDQKEAHSKFVDLELDGLYELAKIILPMTQRDLTLTQASQLLLRSVGLQLKHRAQFNFQVDDGPHIFIANQPGCFLVDAALGTTMIARLGLRPSTVGIRNIVDATNTVDAIEIEAPKIAGADPREDRQIAQLNTKAIAKMRAVLTMGQSLLLFPGNGLLQSLDTGPQLIERNFNYLAPALLACRDLCPKLHLIHIDYEVPAWWTRLHEQNKAKFFAKQWKAVLSLRSQTATVRHLESVVVNPDISKQQRYELCHLLHHTLVEAAKVQYRKRQILAA